jgi:molybdopterin synthase sulfur carrier subunit
VRVVFELAGPLRQHAAGAVAVEVDVPNGASVADALDALAKAHPAVERRIRDDEGLLRRHVNLFAGGDLIRGSENTTELCPGERLVVLPAVSGGAGSLS